MLETREGQAVPQVIFKTRKDGQFVDVSSDDIFKGRTVIVFSLPGAFTPTCSSTHLPRFNELAPVFRENGVDEIVCMSVNDAFVMDAWGADQEAANITLIPDGNGEFTEGMGMLVDKLDLGFGKRSWRYSMLVKDGVIVKQFVEPEVAGDPFVVSDADTMLDHINPKARKPEPVSIITKPGCPYCVKAKALLNDHRIGFEEIVLGKDASSISLKAITGRHTVPQVYIGGNHIGGAEDLEDYLKRAHRPAA